MPIRTVTGRAHLLKPRLISDIVRSMQTGDHALVLVVPAQYALQAEMDVIEALDIPGSFRLQVLPPARLYDRIFEQAGQPDAVLVNAQGRAMMMYSAIRSVKDDLRFYRRAQSKAGFVARAVEQVSLFKQAGLQPGDVRKIADGLADAALRDKLFDIALLYEAYERLLEGKFMDEEDEAREALSRVKNARLFDGCEAWFYGFDLITPAVAQAALALFGTARQVSLYASLENDASARDFDVYQPMKYTFDRLHREVMRLGIPWSRERVSDSVPGARQSGLNHLTRELFCVPARADERKPDDVHLAYLKNPRDEAEYCAAAVRHLVMSRGWRYMDIAVACADLGAYENVLVRAFQLYDVPIFLSESRPADRHPLAKCLLGALTLVTRGWRGVDVQALVRTGYMNLTDDEADEVIEYAKAWGLRFGAFKTALKRGDEREIERIEPLRQKLVEPLLALDSRLRGGDSTKARLFAVYQFLEDIGARDQLEKEQAALTAQGRRVWAMEGAQVYNRIIEALDQMSELLSERLSGRDILALLRQALAATDVKALPQSADAVAGGSVNHMKSKSVRALMLIGATDQTGAPDETLLSDAEKQMVSEAHAADDEGRLWLGLTAVGRSRLNRHGVKALLGSVRDFLWISSPMSDMKGAALQRGVLVESIQSVLPGLQPYSGALSERRDHLRMKLNAPNAALAQLPSLLRDDPSNAVALDAASALAGLDEAKNAVQSMRASFAHRVQSDPLSDGLESGAYASLSRVSISRLEQYALCPFRHFVKYALRPEPVREFHLSRADAGVFYHNAVELFMRENGDFLNELLPEDAASRMDAVTDLLIDEVTDRHLGDTALAEKEKTELRRVARRAAQTIVKQMAGGQFSLSGVEVEFGDGACVRVGDSVLTGRIDRIDEWRDGDRRFLRVIDYKTGGKHIALSDIYYGLQLQLMLYLAAAVRESGGVPAGALYFAVDDPVIRTDALDPVAVDKERDKALRMRGLLLKDEQVVRAMSSDPERTVNVRFKKDGSFYANDRLLSKEDFDALMHRAFGEADRMLSEIQSGETRIEPVEDKLGLSCRYCEYGAICQHEKNLPGARARKIVPMKDGEVLEALRGGDGQDTQP